MSRDERVVYGARCSWWGSITEVATKPSGLPCCPHCGGVLFETDAASWRDGAERHSRESGDEHYVRFVDWLRGQCRPSLAEARAEFDALPAV